MQVISVSWNLSAVSRFPFYVRNFHDRSMKKALIRLFHLLLVTTFAISFTGCQNRPNRPTPDQTMSGLGPGDSVPFDVVGGGTMSGGSDFTISSDDTFFGSDTGLEARSDLDLFGEQMRGVLQPIYFEFDRSTLAQSEREKAQDAAAYLRNNPSTRLLIEGHCDWRGTTEYNLGLGDRRASSVRDYLISIGIDPSRLEILSKGDLEAAQGGTEQEMAHDRRAELVVLQN